MHCTELTYLLTFQRKNIRRNNQQLLQETNNIVDAMITDIKGQCDHIELIHRPILEGLGPRSEDIESLSSQKLKINDPTSVERKNILDM